MSFYTDLRSTADTLLRDKGQAMTLTQIAAGAYDPDTGTSTPTEAEHPVRGAVFDYSERTIAGSATADGTLIQAGDRKVLLSAQGLTVVPAPGWKLTIGAVVWQIVNVKTSDPGGVAVLYTLQVRR